MTDAPFDLAAIQQHPKYPFADWQSDDVSFLMLEMFWAELLRDVIGAEAAAEWVPRYDTPRDGNPILALGNPKTRRALRIVVTTNVDGLPVYPEATGGMDAYYYFSAFNGIVDEMDGTPPWEELGFFVELHPSILETARLFLQKFCTEQASLDEIEALIEAYESNVGMDQVPE